MNLVLICLCITLLTVQGCADLALPTDMFFRKLGEQDGIVGCLDAPNTWPVTCIDNNWLGKWDNCTRCMYKFVNVILRFDAELINMNFMESVHKYLHYENFIV